MHYRGLLRVARRDSGTRVYAVRRSAAPDAALSAIAGAGGPAVDLRIDALVDVIVQKYAPLPSRSLGQLLSHLKSGVPQWASHRAAALKRATGRLARTRVDGIDWYWPAGETPGSARWRSDEEVRLLTPFDPVVWDRRRFEIFWGWAYRFEAYTPAPKRKLGYYALPLLWRERVIGWGNLSLRAGQLESAFGYIQGRPPRAQAYRRGLEEELARIRAFLHLA
jgi:uncharacterized protein YcaQ